MASRFQQIRDKKKADRESKKYQQQQEYDKYISEEEQRPPKDINSKIKELDSLLDKVSWYNKKVFDIVTSGTSIMELSRKTGISYYSLYNTFTNVKKLIKKEIKWD